MSVEMMNRAWYVPGLTPAQKAVLVALADHADSAGGNAYPSVGRLCTKTSYAERTVRRALGDLRDMELIVVQYEATRHKPTVYSLDLPQMHPSESLDLPENTVDLPENTARPATDAPKPSLTVNEQPSLNGIGTFADVVKAYENEIGVLSQLVSDKLADAVDEFGAAYVVDAIGIAVENNVRKWAYVDGILKRWRANGRYTSVKKAEAEGVITR